MKKSVIHFSNNYNLRTKTPSPHERLGIASSKVQEWNVPSCPCQTFSNNPAPFPQAWTCYVQSSWERMAWHAVNHQHSNHFKPFPSPTCHLFQLLFSRLCQQIVLSCSINLYTRPPTLSKCHQRQPSTIAFLFIYFSVS